jgi:hypothetical protein
MAQILRVAGGSPQDDSSCRSCLRTARRADAGLGSRNPPVGDERQRPRWSSPASTMRVEPTLGRWPVMIPFTTSKSTTGRGVSLFM